MHPISKFSQHDRPTHAERDLQLPKELPSICALRSMVALQPVHALQSVAALTGTLPHPTGRAAALWGRLVSGLLLGGALLVSGCAMVNDAGMRVVSTGADAVLLIQGQLLTGKVLLVPDRTGRFSFAAQPVAAPVQPSAAAPAGPAPVSAGIASCAGGMRHTATLSGSMDLRCSDGSDVALQFSLLSETRGHAYGQTAQGPVSLVFGMSEQDTLAHLVPPPGKRVELSAEGLWVLR